MAPFFSRLLPGAPHTPENERAAYPPNEGGARGPEPEELRGRRERLLDDLVRAGDLRERRVLEVMRRVPRHLFVPEPSAASSYDNEPLPIGWGQTISQPTIVAVMTEALDLSGEERVLEVGTGSGYQTAILSLLAREVCSIERVPELGRRARALLESLGCDNVRAIFGDGYAGFPERAPFDRIIVTAAPPHIPRALLDQLVYGGILVTPVGDSRGDSQWLLRIRKTREGLSEENLGPVRFVPMIEGLPAGWD